VGPAADAKVPTERAEKGPIRHLVAPVKESGSQILKPDSVFGPFVLLKRNKVRKKTYAAWACGIIAEWNPIPFSWVIAIR
jgi:hypothetical protein